MIKMCEISGCPQPISEVLIGQVPASDERAHLCPGHAYALVICIEHNTEEQKRWLAEWTWDLPIEAFLNMCRAIAEGHRVELLAWRERSSRQ